MGVIASLHFGKEKGQQLGTEVHVSPDPGVSGMGQRGELRRRAHYRLVLAVGIDAMCRLGAVRNAGSE